jgi:hypothetical protein
MEPAIDPVRCPLCGEANTCGVAAGGATCWCFELQVPASVLARIPEAARGVACICPRCAAGEARAGESDEDSSSGREAARRRLAQRWIQR